jgi:hypothetical protein
MAEEWYKRYSAFASLLSFPALSCPPTQTLIILATIARVDYTDAHCQKIMQEYTQHPN